MDSYLKSINIGYNSTTSIFTVENKTLMGYSSSTYKLENGTKGMIEYTLMLKVKGYNASKPIKTLSTNKTFQPLLYEPELTTHAELSKFVNYVNNTIKTQNNSSARAVGYMLSINQDPDKIPCYKVVHTDRRMGKYALGMDEKEKTAKERWYQDIQWDC